MSEMIYEYIWLDGCNPPNLRSKIKICDDDELSIQTFDGSSTKQSSPERSDLVLNPVRVYENPLFTTSNLLYSLYPAKLILCEVLDEDMNPTETSTARRKLAYLVQKYRNEEILVSIEQEYVLMDARHRYPLGWHPNHHPQPSDAYYCGVGAKSVVGREIAEEHLFACLDAGISISGMNAEVMLSQWEYQIGICDPLRAADDLIVSRYLLYRICERYSAYPSFDPKPVKGWSGSGCHINISTKRTRSQDDKIRNDEIKKIISKLRENHEILLKNYGKNNHERLTGEHETCRYDEFRYGVMDRTASVRIPWLTHRGYAGYIEDRRPAANMNPYDALSALLSVLFEEVES